MIELAADYRERASRIRSEIESQRACGMRYQSRKAGEAWVDNTDETYGLQAAAADEFERIATMIDGEPNS